MEKKNTMLLTVIAVATLLVAVVGATFAYFSLSVGGNATTTATVTTGKVGTVTITGGTTDLKLKVNATDMTQAIAQGAQHDYYAITDTEWPTNEGAATGGIYSKSEQKFEIGKATLAEGDENATYTCGYKVTVTKAKGSSEGDMSTALQAGDVFFTITGDESSTIESASNVDLFSAKEEYKGTFTLKGGSATSTVKASLKLVNQNKEQNALAGKEMTVKFTVAADEEKPCTITTTAAAE